MESVWFALSLTLVAGMATGIGSIVAFAAKRTNYRFLAVSTAFSAGVMLYVSFIEIFVKGVDALAKSYGDYWANWINAASFFGGVLLIGLIDNLIPAAENPHETHSAEEMAPLHDASAPFPDFKDKGRIVGARSQTGAHDHKVGKGRLMRTGLFTALVIGIHNFPEGLATFLGA
ncbi:MAG TPA: zinc transporter ZupT, partial [Deltaproteobacteria bacterium]|nr:zinc transporter ZupT [Deltaproteobacteria bacterium]